MTNACSQEDYRGSHIKGKLERHGYRFLIVKQRKGGKVWGKFYALLTDDLEPMALGSNNSKGRGDHGPQTEEEWGALFLAHYPPTLEGKQALKEALARIRGE